MVICFIADAKSINTVNWVKHLAEKHIVHVITFNDNIIENVIVHKICALGLFGKLRYLFAIGKVKKLLNEIKPDIINGYYISSYGLLSRMVGFRPLVLTVAGSDIFGGFLSSKIIILRICMGFLLRFTLRGANLIFCWTDVMKERVISLGGDESRIYVMPRGIDLSKYYITRRNKSVSKIIRIAHTRSLKNIYNIPVILDVIRRIKKRGSEVELLMIGDGPLKKRSEIEAVNSNILDSVKFLGKTSYSDIPKLLCSCVFYISMSSSDGASSSLFEAMACGLFPVVSDIEPNRIWIKNKENGFLFGIEEVEKMADKIIMANNDINYLKKVIDINHYIVQKKLSWEKNIIKIEDRIVYCAQKYEQSKN